jgi:hypothetical protein
VVAYWEKLLNESFPGPYEMLYTAHLVTTRGSLRQYSRDYWRHFLNLYQTEGRYPYGYVLERFWHRLFHTDVDYFRALRQAHEYDETVDDLYALMRCPAGPLTV